MCNASSVSILSTTESSSEPSPHPIMTAELTIVPGVDKSPCTSVSVDVVRNILASLCPLREKNSGPVEPPVSVPFDDPVVRVKTCKARSC